jgi:hypothetical protein
MVPLSGLIESSSLHPGEIANLILLGSQNQAHPKARNALDVAMPFPP